MAETKEKKGFNAGIYAVFAGVIIAVILVVLTIFAFTTRYTAFSPEKVAQSFTDTIVQTGDGYNAYKITLVSKNSKYGDFIRKAYMAPYVNEYVLDDKGEPMKDEKGKAVKVPQAEFVGTGNEEEQKAIDEVYNTMYDYYLELIATYGMDDYDTVFNSYFSKLREVRHNVYGDDFMNTEYMFGAFEANVDTYGKSLTGTEKKLAQDNKTVLQEETVGKYQDMYGKDYKLTATVTGSEDVAADAYVSEYKARITATIEAYNNNIPTGLNADTADGMKGAVAALDNSDAITAVKCCTVDVTNQNGDVVATQQIYVVEIGNSWYVDNTNIDTSALYLAK